jgi:hypothetical protein
MKYQIKRDEKMRKRRPKSKSGTTIYTFVMFAALAALIAVLAVAYVQGCEARLSKELQTTDTEEPLTRPSGNGTSRGGAAGNDGGGNDSRRNHPSADRRGNRQPLRKFG